MVFALFDYSVDSTSFQVISLQPLFVYALYGVGHQYEVYWFDTFHANLENSVNPGKKGMLVLFQMIEVLVQLLHDDVQLFGEHSLYNKSLIFGEKEETTTFASTLACLPGIL